MASSQIVTFTIDQVTFKVYASDPVRKVHQAWCSRTGRFPQDTFVRCQSKIFGPGDTRRVGEVVAEGEAWSSADGRTLPSSVGSSPGEFTVLIEKVQVSALPTTAARKVVKTMCQRNCLPADTCYRVVRTGQIITALDERPLSEVSVNRDTWERV